MHSWGFPGCAAPSGLFTFCEELNVADLDSIYCFLLLVAVTPALTFGGVLHALRHVQRAARGDSMLRPVVIAPFLSYRLESRRNYIVSH